jgi:hypothetical protein
MIYYPRTREHEVPMTPTERTRVTRVELYGRETLPRPAQSRRSAVVDRLEALSAAGHIAAFDVSSWPKRVPCTGPHCEARDRYRAFSAWADEYGVDLAPFFQTRECYSMVTGERGEWVVLPALCLAAYDGDDLVAVYPHTDVDSYESVGSALDWLEGPADSTDTGRDSLPAGMAD